MPSRLSQTPNITLQAASEHIYQATELTEPNDARVWNIGNVHLMTAQGRLRMIGKKGRDAYSYISGVIGNNRSIRA